MPFTKVKFKPGIYREGTAYDNGGGWFDCNLVRFRDGRVEKFGGWEKLSSQTFLGNARALHNWLSLGSNLYLGIGTTVKYLARVNVKDVDGKGGLQDIKKAHHTLTYLIEQLEK
jgi:molecular chaperone DnaK (HSP70)